TASRYRDDSIASTLTKRLVIKTEPRVYLLRLSFSSTRPELAAEIPNAFAAELQHATALQRLHEQRALVHSALLDQLATLGEKHPSVPQARRKLATLDALVDATERDTSGDALGSANEQVTAAQIVAVPSGPDLRQILIGGLAGGLGVGMIIAFLL